MNCPRDGSPLDGSKLRGVPVDVCSYCNGIWLDASELSQLHGLPEDLTSAVPAPCPQPLTCPSCASAMERFYFSQEQRVEVDRCPSCGGVWLDTDELKAVLQTTGARGRPGPARSPVVAAPRPQAAAQPAAEPPPSEPALLLTTLTPPGETISQLLGLVTGDAVVGAESIANSLAHVKGVIAGKAGFSQVLDGARKLAFKQLTETARARGANAVVGVQAQHTFLGESGLLVTVTGTAAILR